MLRFCNSFKFHNLTSSRLLPNRRLGFNHQYVSLHSSTLKGASLATAQTTINEMKLYVGAIESKEDKSHWMDLLSAAREIMEPHKAHPLSDEDTINLLAKADQLVGMDQIQDAFVVLRTAAREYPLDTKLWKALSKLEVKSNSLYRAKLYLKIADMADKQRGGRDYSINIDLANIELQMKNFDQARKSYQAGVEKCSSEEDLIEVASEWSALEIRPEIRNITAARQLWSSYICIKGDNYKWFRVTAMQAMNADLVEDAHVLLLRGFLPFTFRILKTPYHDTLSYGSILWQPYQRQPLKKLLVEMGAVLKIKHESLNNLSFDPARAARECYWRLSVYKDNSDLKFKDSVIQELEKYAYAWARFEYNSELREDYKAQITALMSSEDFDQHVSTQVQLRTFLAILEASNGSKDMGYKCARKVINNIEVYVSQSESLETYSSKDGWFLRRGWLKVPLHENVACCLDFITEATNNETTPTPLQIEAAEFLYDLYCSSPEPLQYVVSRSTTSIAVRFPSLAPILGLSRVIEMLDRMDLLLIKDVGLIPGELHIIRGELLHDQPRRAYAAYEQAIGSMLHLWKCHELQSTKGSTVVDIIGLPNLSSLFHESFYKLLDILLVNKNSASFAGTEAAPSKEDISKMESSLWFKVVSATFVSSGYADPNSKILLKPALAAILSPENISNWLRTSADANEKYFRRKQLFSSLVSSIRTKVIDKETIAKNLDQEGKRLLFSMLSAGSAGKVHDKSGRPSVPMSEGARGKGTKERSIPTQPVGITATNPLPLPVSGFFDDLISRK